MPPTAPLEPSLFAAAPPRGVSASDAARTIEILDFLRANEKCLILFTQDMLSRIVVGAEAIVGRGGAWKLGVIEVVPRRRTAKAPKTKRLFHVNVGSISDPQSIGMELL
jgi:hypothetical protein